MVSAQELIVAIRSEGVRETVSDLRGVSDNMDETASATGEAAEKAEGFSTTFKGAVTAAAASLAVASAGLLSQVPVVGEVFSGLGAVIDAIVVKMDEVLRPVLTPLTDFFFDLAGGISETDGTMADIIGVVASVGAILAVLAGALSTAALAIAPFVGGFSGVASIAGTVAGVITTVGAAILSLPGLLALAVAAIVGFAAAYALGIGDVREKTDAFAQKVRTAFRDFLTTIRQKLIAAKEIAKTKAKQLFDKVVSKFETGKATALTVFANLKDDAIAELVKAKEGAKTKAKEIFSSAVTKLETGKANALGVFVGLKDDAIAEFEAIKSGAAELGAGVIEAFLKAFKKAGDLASGALSKVSDALGIDLSLGDLPDFSSATGDGDSGTDTGTGGGTGRAGTGSNSAPIATTLDGQSLVESTGRFARDSTARNGGL